MKFRESIIRQMTRLAHEYGAINLSQGYPNEPPMFEMVWKAVCALLGGNSKQLQKIDNSNWEALDNGTCRLKETMNTLQGAVDIYNQYSIPFGNTKLREKIANYYERIYNLKLNHQNEITVTLGATEGICVALRSIAEIFEGNEVCVALLEPCHEMYYNQASLFNLECNFFTLKENKNNQWFFNLKHFENILISNEKKKKKTIFVLNSPQNPTGKVFTKKELEPLCELCNTYDAFIITDEIYEHMIYDDEKHHMLYGWKHIKDRVICVNSISKTGNATGWRIGWIIASSANTHIIRAVHDTMAMQAPTPFQVAAEQLLAIEDYSYIKEKLLRKRELLINALREIGFAVNTPCGAYYLFANYKNVPIIGEMSSTEAAEFLIRKIGVATVPGDAFYCRTKEERENDEKSKEEKENIDSEKYIRFAFCRTVSDLEEAIKRLKILNFFKCNKSQIDEKKLPDRYFEDFYQNNNLIN